MNNKYIVTAGSNSTDLGVVGSASTLLGAKRIGRKAVRESLPNGEGSYRVQEWVIGETGITVTVTGAERSIRTGFRWAES